MSTGWGKGRLSVVYDWQKKVKLTPKMWPKTGKKTTFPEKKQLKSTRKNQTAVEKKGYFAKGVDKYCYSPGLFYTNNGKGNTRERR